MPSKSYSKKKSGSKRKPVRKGPKKSGRKGTKKTVTKRTYSRKRSVARVKRAPSPVGYGIHARYTPIGETMRGTDRKLWIVARRSNGSHFWKHF